MYLDLATYPGIQDSSHSFVSAVRFVTNTEPQLIVAGNTRVMKYLILGSSKRVLHSIMSGLKIYCTYIRSTAVCTSLSSRDSKSRSSTNYQVGTCAGFHLFFSHLTRCFRVALLIVTAVCNQRSSGMDRNTPVSKVK